MAEVGADTGPVVGVDVGGTKVAAAVVDARGCLHGRVQQMTDARNPELALESVKRAILAAIDASGFRRSEIMRVGLGIPGPVDPQAGLGLLSVNMGWHNFPVRDRLEAAVGLPCRIENDVKAAALGESRHGVGRGCRNLIYLSVGTGIAAGIILDGRLYRGSTGMSGEIGHAVVDAAGPVCKCGSPGCLEAVAAGPAIAARALAAWGATAGVLTAATVFEASARGDTTARQIVADTGSVLAHTIRWLVMAFDPEVVVLGGGVAGAGQALLEVVRGALARQAGESYVFRALYRPELIQLTALGRDVGILGAAALPAVGAG